MSHPSGATRHELSRLRGVVVPRLQLIIVTMYVSSFLYYEPHMLRNILEYFIGLKNM